MATPAPLTIEQQMAANSAAWKTAAPEQRTVLHNQNLELAKQTGQTYNSGTGTYSTPAPPQTIQPTSVTKTDSQYVPFISGNKDPNGGNTTEYRAPRAGDTGIGVTPPTPQMTSAPPPSPTTTPAPQGLYQDPYARSPQDIAKLAADRIAKILQAGRTSAAGALTGAKNAYNYTNAIEKDTRSLEDASFAETNNPFSGKYQYDKTNVSRYRGIEDTSQDNNYNAAVGQINQKLADLEAAAPGDEQAIIDELQQIERQTGINVAQLQEQQKQNQLNQSNYQQTFNYNAGQDQIQNDRNATNDAISNYGNNLTNQLNELKLGNYSTEVKQQAQLFEQELKSGKLTNEAAEYNLAELKNPKSATNLAKQYEAEIKRLELAGLPERERLELQKLNRQIADIGVTHYKPQTQAEIDYDKQQVIKIKAEIDKIKSDTNGKSLKGKDINVKESSDNYGMILEDIGTANDLAEAYTVIEQNVDNLTDADYKAAKAAARERFDKLAEDAKKKY